MTTEPLLQQAEQLHKAGQLEAAEAAYRSLLHQHPIHAQALHQLGVLIFQRHGTKQAEEALTLVRAAIQIRPSCACYRHSLGRIHELTGRPQQALDAYERAVEKQPGSVQYLLDLGRTLKAVDRHGRAAEVYRRAAALQPDHRGVHAKLAWVLKHLGRHEEAVQHFRHHLRLNPGHLQSQFWIAALSGDSSMAACPAGLVAGLFDSYADHFDQHLTQKLGYQTPQMLLNLLLSCTNQSSGCSTSGCEAPWPAAADLGCGTGLMGPLLRPYVGHLAGVDLSSGMVDKARTRGCYDALAVGELVEYLQGSCPGGGGGADTGRAGASDEQRSGCGAGGSGGGSCTESGRGSQGAVSPPWDLLVAADVFVYIGDLQPVMAAAALAAAPRALFCFSTEHSSDGSGSGGTSGCNGSNCSEACSCAKAFRLQPTGRYAHAPSYLRWLAKATGWVVVRIEQGVIRYNAGKPIYGSLCVMQLASI